MKSVFAVIFTLLFFIIPGCYDPWELGPKVNEWKNKESQHFIYYYLEGNEVSTEDKSIGINSLDDAIKRQETRYGQLSSILGVTLQDKIHFYKYASPDHMAATIGVTGTEVEGVVFPNSSRNEIHSLSSYHPHEVVHALANQINLPPALLVEGLAVYYGNRTASHVVPVELVRNGKLIPISSIIYGASFYGADKFGEEAVEWREKTYIEAGSFTKFLIDKYGSERFLRFYATTHQSSIMDNNIYHQVQVIYNRSINSLEDEWMEYLKSFLAPNEK